MPAAVLELRSISKRYGDVAAVDDVSFTVQSGQILALLGPSGCGKTTILRMIAGFVDPDSGSLVIGGRDMRGVRPHERNVGLVFQDYALFPHLSVERNIAYGLQQRGDSREAIAARVREMLSLVRLEGFGDRRPALLSGGQQQRVALARAMAVAPEIMLLDEPLSALDAKLRQQLRMELKQILQAVRCTTLIVTHDQEEAMSLADEIVVLDGGRVLQQGSAAVIYQAPSSRAVAEFIGRANWFEGEAGVEISTEWHEFITPEGRFVVPAAPLAFRRGPRAFCVRPERLLMLSSDSPVEEEFNLVPGSLVYATCLGSEIHHAVALTSGRTVLCIEQNRDQTIPPPGAQVRVAFRPRDCIFVS